MVNIEDIIYFAGLFDGEGTITLLRNHKNENKTPVISMTSTTEELVHFCKNTFGGVIRNQKTYKEHYKKAWVWSIIQNRSLEIMELVEPYMKEPKKKARIRYILENYKRLTPRNGRYTKEMIKEKLNFEEEFFKLS